MQDTQLTMFLTNWRFWEQTPLAQPLVQQKPVILLRDEKRINKRGAQGCWLLHAARTIEATGQVYQEVVCCVRLAMIKLPLLLCEVCDCAVVMPNGDSGRSLAPTSDAEWGDVGLGFCPKSLNPKLP